MADKKDQRFTFDSDKDGQEVPTLTSLLYKKNAVKTASSSAAPSEKAPSPGRSSPKPVLSRMMTLEPTTTTTVEQSRPLATEEPTTITLTNAPTELARPDTGPASGVAKALGALKGNSGSPRIIPAGTRFSPSPVIRPVGADRYSDGAFAATALRTMISKPRVNAALVFEATSPETYRLGAILQSPGVSSRTGLWNGMEFTTPEFIELGEKLTKYGFAEFSTLGATGAGNYERMAFRNAFAAKAGEWVTFIRVKEASGKDGIVVVLSEVSVQAYLPNFQSEVLGAAGSLSLAA